MDADQFEQALRDEVEREAGETAAAMRQAVPPEQQWPGLDRHLNLHGG